MTIALSDDNELRAFDREILALIGRSELLQAENRVREAIGQAASASLKSTSDIPVGSLRIEGWRNLCADLAKADAILREKPGERLAFAVLDVDNEASIPRLDINRSFYAAFERHENGGAYPSSFDTRVGIQRPVFIAGLEAVMAVQRTPWPGVDHESAIGHQIKIDRLLAGLLLATKVNQVFDCYLDTRGLPLQVSFALNTFSSHPYPLDWSDLGPDARRFIEAPTIAVASPDLAAKLLAERQAADAGDFQVELNTFIAEIRELYRLVRCYPFHRFIGRYRLGTMLTSHLKAICSILEIPETGVSWRMSKPKFEALLRIFAEAKEIPSVEDALDVRHVNDLHEKRLKVAKQYGFELPLPHGTLFEIALAHSLKFGGPIVQERWENAKVYSSIADDATAR